MKVARAPLERGLEKALVLAYQSRRHGYGHPGHQEESPTVTDKR